MGVNSIMSVIFNWLKSLAAGPVLVHLISLIWIFWRVPLESKDAD